MDAALLRLGHDGAYDALGCAQPVAVLRMLVAGAIDAFCEVCLEQRKILPIQGRKRVCALLVGVSEALRWGRAALVLEVFRASKNSIKNRVPYLAGECRKWEPGSDPLACSENAINRANRHANRAN